MAVCEIHRLCTLGTAQCTRSVFKRFNTNHSVIKDLAHWLAPIAENDHAKHRLRSPLQPAPRPESQAAATIRDARGARPRGVVAPLEEVCFQPEAESAICVQRFDDSLNSAIRTTYRISLRSSSLLMPRYPSTRVV